MKTGKLFDGMLLLASVACMTLLSSCNKGDDVVENTNPGPGVYDLEVSNVGIYSAKLKAKVTMPEQIGMDFELGFELSESDAFPKGSTTRYKVDSYNPDRTFTYDLSGLKTGVTYHVRAYMLNRVCLYKSQVKSFTPDWQYVDLGLSVKWATCNVGATAPEGYGDYFAWGATEPWYQPGYAQYGNPVWRSGKSAGYTWVNTPYQTASTTDYSSTKWTKYLGSTSSSYKDASATDADALKTVLDPADDAAHANWGGSWRMPTKAEQDELRNTGNCTWTWTTLNGVKGYKVVSKKPGYEGNWIFLPAAGHRSSTDLYYAGSYGAYWSSSLGTGYPYYAWYLDFDSGDRDAVNYCRYCGQSVRPVCPKN